MTNPTRPVFISYASQDVDAGRGIAEALRETGVEVWFDQNSLKGGTAWDAEIRSRIRDCALFVAVISANTESRLEGYFRLEWRLAEQRTHLMAKGTPFLLPVVIDNTPETNARVPDSFLEVQWTRVNVADDFRTFANQVASLLHPDNPPSVLHGQADRSLLLQPHSMSLQTQKLPAIAVRPSDKLNADWTNLAGAHRRMFAAAAAIAAIILASLGAVVYRNSEARHWVREVAIPKIVWLSANDRTVEALQLIEKSEKYAPDDLDLARAVASATRVATLHSTPPGAVVEVKDYVSPKSPWLRLGTTPLDKVRIPGGYLRWKVTKAGLGESITAPPPAETISFDLVAAAKAPAGMVLVSGGPWTDYLAFLGWMGPYALPPFYIDRFEVTNRQYQEFVDKGGYSTRGYWKQSFTRNGRDMAWNEAMDLFRDATGRPGPSTWEGGHYPEGKGDYPVSGISWFEAAAYAEFAGKALPVIAQGYRTMPPSFDRFVVEQSNLTGNLAPVGQFSGLGPFGTFDLVGNVREWYWNAGGSDLRYALGRQASSYGPEALSPFDRSALNGVRCVRNQGPIPSEAVAPRMLLTRDFSKVQPVDEKTFTIYRDMYAYDHGPLNATRERLADTSVDWTTEKVTIDAAYAGEHIPAYLFLPKHVRPPFQVVVFFPSARVNFSPSSADLGDMGFVDYVIESGRAVLYPIYKGLYERHFDTPMVPGPTLERENLISWSKDIGRAIDYLKTRTDIDANNIAYLGVSQGAAYGVILVALEQRFKTAVFLDGGMFQFKPQVAGLDQVDFAQRLTQPVLMVNGRYDATFPYETSQQPLFHLLATPQADKRQVDFDTAHDVRLRRTDLVKEVLQWFDKYLGRVQ